jgi:hypothetical protein
MNIKILLLIITLNCLLTPQETQAALDTTIISPSELLHAKIIEFALKSDPGVFPTVTWSAEVSAAVRFLSLDEIIALKKRICKYHCRCLGAFVDLLPDFATEAAYSAFLTTSEPYLKNATTFIVIQDPDAGYLVFTEKNELLNYYMYTARYGMSLIQSTSRYHLYFSNFVYNTLQKNRSKPGDH